MHLCKVPEVKQQRIACKGDTVMGHHSCHDSIFIFDVLHAPADAVESDHKGLCPPETEESAEEGEVEDQIADVCEMFLLVMFL